MYTIQIIINIYHNKTMGILTGFVSTYVKQ